jgi:predicted transcriptional regulator
LLFEFRARSFIPVALTAAVATTVRAFFVGWAPLFPTPTFALTRGAELWLFALMGIFMGIVGIIMIRTLFWIEDFFDHLPIKHALIWSPAIGAAILGAIGYFYPQVLGTGYDTIRDMLNDHLTTANLLGISLGKFWALVISLGSGTTGGVFAPSLIVGGGLGAVYAILCQHIFPHLVSDPAFYALVAMAAVFGGIARAPFTSIVFLFELSHNPNSLLPLIVCVMISDGFVRLFSRDSIMTGKLVKRGLIVLQDYSVPVMMRARISQVMQQQFPVIESDTELRTILQKFAPENGGFLPVVEKDGTIVGIVEAHDLLKVEPANHKIQVRELARQDYVRAYPEELVDCVNREMLRKNVENVIVFESPQNQKAIGIVRANDILQLRRWFLEEETKESRIPAAKPAAGTVSS